MAVKFLDLTGLQRFWDKCKSAFVAKDTSGNVSVARPDGVTNGGNLTVAGTITAGGKATVAGVESSGGIEIKGENSLKLYGENNLVSVELKSTSDSKLEVNGEVMATRLYVDTAIAAAPHIKRERVEGDVLPGVATAKENVIYMLARSDGQDWNGYDEYMLIDGDWERVGSSDVDLSNYSTTQQMNSAISTAIYNAAPDSILNSEIDAIA